VTMTIADGRLFFLIGKQIAPCPSNGMHSIAPQPPILQLSHTHTFIYCQCQPHSHSHTYNLNYNKHSFFTSI
jgi:hypothetical protein